MLDTLTELGEEIPPHVRDKLIYAELKTIVAQLEAISNNLSRIETETGASIAATTKAVVKNSEKIDHIQEHRPLTWWLVNEPTRTITFIILAFLALSIVWVSTVRQSILHFFGSPVIF